MGYQKETIKGASWIGALRVTTRVIALIKTTVIARLLSPSAFGVFGISMVVMALLEILTETGINVFLLQEKDDVDEFVNTSWVVSIFRGVLIAIILVLCSSLVASFFKSPESQPLIILVSLVPLIRGFINPSEIKLQKDLKFKKDFVFRFTIFTFDALVAIVATLITKNAAGAIFGLIAGAILEVVLSFLIVKPRPKFILEIEKTRKVLDRGKWITGAGIFDYLFENIDDITVGRFLGSGPLGLYQMAYKLATLPITEVADVFGKVTLPIYVKISGDTKRIKRAFIKSTIGIAFLTIPFGIVLILFSKQIILIILGKNWLDAAPAVQFITVYAILRAIINPALTLFLSVKKQEYVTSVILLGTITLGISIIPLTVKLGLVGAGISTIIAVSVMIPMTIFYTIKLFNGKWTSTNE
ncbi:lipopolysaccharide biosynthesis protein [Candidatus Woesebacteria bacterium]|nr:lipopolysaccharide biosynthesis protein [Candidatus Woesebacteria bacterium]QQG47148.1 MAG: lipopolysaccharide biosynthesis protein [Candidatus Woesebacteria bacterium]